MKYREGDYVFDNWQIVELIGEGGFGSVYKLRKNELGVETESALKIIEIPKTQGEIQSAMSEGMDRETVTAMYQTRAEEFVDEIRILSSLKGHPNIVRYLDHRIENAANNIGKIVLIRMELLTSLPEYLAYLPMTEKDTIRMGKELCSALVYCQSKNLIHRDIKPENIFVDKQGHFKLGDFGIARTAEMSTAMMSRKGTEAYIAPEVFLARPYNSNVDLYSLGLVLYKLVNGGRLPFYPSGNGMIRLEDRERALQRRLSGEKIPAPSGASHAFAEVIGKALEFDPKARYRTAQEMLTALEQMGRTQPVQEPARKEPEPVRKPARKEPEPAQKPVHKEPEVQTPVKEGGGQPEAGHKEGKKGTPLALILVTIMFLAVSIMMISHIIEITAKDDLLAAILILCVILGVDYFFVVLPWKRYFRE